MGLRMTGLWVMAGVLAACDPGARPAPPAAEGPGVETLADEAAHECDTRSPRSGDVDGDGRADVVSLEPAGHWEWTVRVRHGSGADSHAAVGSTCRSSGRPT